MKWIVIVFAALTMALAGCEKAETNDAVEEIDDELTRSAQWPDEPERIVSMAPNITELLFELGLGDRVVAVTRYCDWPAETEDLPKIGGMLDPDYEAILAAEPDVVVGVKDGADHQIIKKFDSAGIAYGFLQVDELSTILKGIEDLGTWFGVEDRAERVATDLQDRLQRASKSAEERFDGREMSAIIVFDTEPIVAAGPGSYGEELLELAGLTNALGDDVGAYPILDVESVISADPDVIIDVTIGPESEEVLQFWERFDTLEAVREDRVIHIDDPVMMRPGPRIPVALERLGESLEAM